jgi:Dna[CI] antecedent, DciA
MEQIAPALEKVVLASLHHAPADDAPLLAWPLACGSAVAERTRALEYSKGILRVEVPDAGWRAELQLLAPRYVAILNRYKVGTVDRIHFVVRKEAVSAEQ